jgi:4-hydroxy-tetrahydrodipicolinate synthase
METVMAWQVPAGIYHELLTPFSANLARVDHELLAKLTGYAAKYTPAAFVVGSAAGEAMSLTFEERRSLVATVVAAAGKISVLVGLGGVSRPEALALAEAAAGDGASAVLLEPPEYWMLPVAAAVQYYEELVKRCGLPALVVNDPQSHPASSMQLAVHAALNIAGVAGLVDRTGQMMPFADAQCVLSDLRPETKMLAGIEELLSTRLLGATGWFSALGNVSPLLVRELSATGELPTVPSLRINSELVALSHLASGNHPAKLKALVRSCGRDLGEARPPFMRVDFKNWREADNFALSAMYPSGWEAT